MKWKPKVQEILADRKEQQEQERSQRGKNHAKDFKQEGFCTGGHRRKAARRDADSGEGGTHLETSLSRNWKTGLGDNE